MSNIVELAKKKKIRAGHRASATRILRQVQTCISTVPLDASKALQLKRSLEEKLQSLMKLDDEIPAGIEEDDVEQEILQADEVKGAFVQSLGRAEAWFTATF